MDNDAEIDPWAKLGNIDQGTHNNETNQENMAEAAKWKESMSDVSEFGSDTPTQPSIEKFPEETIAEASDTNSPETESRDDNIANASAILNYGLNAAAKERGIDATVQGIENFVYNGQGDPIKQLLTELGIDTKQELSDMSDKSRASKPTENAFRTNNINAPNTTTRSKSGAINAIQEFKELIAEVKSSSNYANLRAEAMKNGKGIYEEAVAKYNTRDLTTLFNALEEQKETAQNQKSEEEKASQEPTPEDQIKNQSSTKNSSPETDATASKGFNL